MWGNTIVKEPILLTGQDHLKVDNSDRVVRAVIGLQKNSRISLSFHSRKIEYSQLDY